MSIYLALPVEEEPEVILSSWSIREDREGLRYFVGFNEINQDGRVSTPIQTFDSKTRVGITQSGRRYILVGRAGSHRDGDYVWSMVVAVRELGSWRDVTAELVPDWRTPLYTREIHGRTREGGDNDEPECAWPLVSDESSFEVSVSSKPHSAIFWRARAYGLVCEQGQTKLEALSEVWGECAIKDILQLPVTEREIYLYAVRAVMQARARGGKRIDPSASIPASLKIWVTAHNSLDVSDGRPVARLDALCEGGSARAYIESSDWNRLKIRPFRFGESDGVWEVFLRALAVREDSKRSP